MATDSDLGAVLRRHGHRVTRPRELVWEVLASADHHLTAEEVAARVRDLDAGVNLASVYRSLALFAELDLARESRLGAGGAARWEQAHPDDHYHLVCTSCGGVQHHAGDVVEGVRTHLRNDHAFRADSIDLVVKGRCRTCGEAAP